MKWLITTNRGAAVPRAAIPRAGYAEFHAGVAGLLGDPDFHIAHYFGVPVEGGLEAYMLLLRDSTGEVMIASHFYGYYDRTPLGSLTALRPQAHPFERDIEERYGIEFHDNPWRKPLRFPFDRAERGSVIESYDFYRMEGESLHEVNVGPIHAGVIEPGAFRFICNGEQVLHLEIALGYQHRGVEELMARAGGLRRSLLAESIAGDSAAAHACACAMAVEKLSAGGYAESEPLWRQRTIALELERMAMHIADTSALCADIGYQTGQVACEALRTIVINTTQAWCGNRFGKTAVRPHGTLYPMDGRLSQAVAANIATVKKRFAAVRADLKSTPSVLARLENCGVVHADQMRAIGGVGLAARASGVVRDVRRSHPWGLYGGDMAPHTSEFGDVMARLTVRMREVLQSADMILSLTGTEAPGDAPAPDYGRAMVPDALSFGLVEGWRGEVCHVALTGGRGEVEAYRVKDPSLHNWLALALAVRGEGISDFPICNKSFNLSYCGHDL